MMRQFVKRLLLFIAPLLVICIPSVSLLYVAGELKTPGGYVKPLREGQLLGLAYTEMNEPYKLRMTADIFRPRVLALGSSRIMQMRKDVISGEYTFYNAGGAINNIWQYNLFLDKVGYSPRLIIMNIDQWYFNPGYMDQRKTFRDDSYEFPHFSLSVIPGFLRDVKEGKINFKRLLDNPDGNIGVSAVLKDNGFADDGSYHYGGLIDDPSSGADYHFRDTYQRIASGDRRFEYGDVADSSVVEALDTFLARCRERQITVTAFLPPFAPAVWKQMEATGKYGYMSQIYGLLEPVFSKYPDCYLYDYTNMTRMGVSDRDFIDGFHGSELIYDLMIRDMLESTPGIRRFFVSSQQLDSIVRQYREKGIRFQ